MSLSIVIDYRFDTTGFFDDPAARAAMEAAADIWEGLVGDEFEDLPAGLTFDITDPSDRTQTRTVTLDAPVDDLIVFVGADDLGGALGLAGPTGFGLDGFSLGDTYERRVSADYRGQGPVSDVEPWAGSISFAIDGDWSFDLNAPVPGRNDFLTTATHEIGHVLGFGTLAGFSAQIDDGFAVGPNALEVSDGEGVPLDATLHVEDGYAGDEVLLDPITITGTRKMPTEVDLALLADIGYEIDGFAAVGSQPALTTEAGDAPVFGSAVADVIEGLGGDDRILGQGGADLLSGGPGADTLLGAEGADTLDGGPGSDRLQGGDGDDRLIGGPGDDVLFGEAGADVIAIGPGSGADTLEGFDLSADRIAVSSELGFADGAAVLATSEKPFINVTRLTLGPDTTLDVFHDAQEGSPLTPEMVVIEPEGAALIPESDVADGVPDFLLEGTPGDDARTASAGNDLFIGSAGDDTLRGGIGEDRAVYAGPAEFYAPTITPDGRVRLDKPDGTDLLEGIERIDLVGGDYLYDLTGGLVDLGYRLYAAAFARTPDEGGLRFWTGRLDAGLGVKSAAEAFISNPEFALRYGDDPTDAEYIDALYLNVLGREADAGGRDFWLGAFASGALDRADMLIQFADNPENIERTRPFLENGVFVSAEELDLSF